MSATACPEANRGVYPGDYLVWKRPRKSCNRNMADSKCRKGEARTSLLLYSSVPTAALR